MKQTITSKSGHKYNVSASASHGLTVVTITAQSGLLLGTYRTDEAPEEAISALCEELTA